MKVVLQKDVKDLGKVGDAVTVAAGYARNFLFPRRLAVEATEKRIKQWAHLNKVAEIKKKKALSEKREVLDRLRSVSVVLQAAAGEGDRLFGSITSRDIADYLEKKGFTLDRHDIVLAEPIKTLGQHRAVVRFAKDLETELAITVDKAP